MLAGHEGKEKNLLTIYSPVCNHKLSDHYINIAIHLLICKESLQYKNQWYSYYFAQELVRYAHDKSRLEHKKIIYKPTNSASLIHKELKGSHHSLDQSNLHKKLTVL